MTKSSNVKKTSFIEEASSKSDALGFDTKIPLGQGRVHDRFTIFKLIRKHNNFPVGGLIPKRRDVAWPKQKQR